MIYSDLMNTMIMTYSDLMSTMIIMIQLALL